MPKGPITHSKSQKDCTLKCTRDPRPAPRVIEVFSHSPISEDEVAQAKLAVNDEFESSNSSNREMRRVSDAGILIRRLLMGQH